MSASGKSTLAFALECHLVDTGHACYVLDGDNIRHGLNKDLGFSHQDRTENIRRIAEVARLMNEAGLVVITAFISPYRDDRALAQKIIDSEYFMEIYVNTSFKVCEKRDPKNMYKRARAGELLEFTGVHSPYEPPVSIDTSTGTVAACVEKVFSELGCLITVSESDMSERLEYPK